MFRAILCFVILPIFIALIVSSEVQHPDVGKRILEGQINTSVECVRDVLEHGRPKLGVPSFNPLLLDNVTIDFDALNLTDIKGKLYIEKGKVVNIPSFVMTEIKNSFVLIPPTYTVHFALHYQEEVISTGSYKMNITYKGQNFWGEGLLSLGVKDLIAQGYIKAIVQTNGVQVKEFAAPITLKSANFDIQGLFKDATLSRNISQQISEFIPKYINENPQIFTEQLSPIMIKFFNDLVAGRVGNGIIKGLVDECILDVVFHPTTTRKPFF